MTLALVLAGTIVVLGASAAALGPRPKRFHAGWFAAGWLMPYPGVLAAAAGVALATPGLAALAAIGGLVTCAVPWLLRMDADSGGFDIDRERFERDAFETYLRHPAGA